MEVSKYSYITVCLKASWIGLIYRTHQHYCQTVLSPTMLNDYSDFTVVTWLHVK